MISHGLSGVISMVVMFIPLLATWRGVFQGYESMGPTAVSEVTEQIARIVFILIGSFLVLNVFMVLIYKQMV